MNVVLRRELLIFMLLFVVLATMIHPDLLSTPHERFSTMMERGNFFHPILYTLIPYLLITILRFIYRALTKLFARKRS